MENDILKGTNPAHPPGGFGDNSADASRAGVITIAVGWSGDRYYKLEHINKVYRAVKRNTTVPFEFVLSAGPEAQEPGVLDGLEAGIRVIASPYRFFWAGMKLYEPGVIEGDLLCMGLDVVIVGSLDDIINYPSELAAMHDVPTHMKNAINKDDVNCEVTLIRNGKHKIFWDEWVRLGKPQWDGTVAVQDRVWPMAIQGWINTEKPFKVDLFPENWIASYKLSVRGRGLPKDCRVVSFHGDPKPWMVDEPWVKEHWY